MSDIKRPKGYGKRKQQYIQLRRGADGRLRSADEAETNETNEIADLWAQQERIRLAQAIEEDAKKANRKKIRKERGLVGVAKKDLSGLTGKVKKELFGKEAVKKAKAKPPTTHTIAGAAPPQIPKAVEININMPGLPKLPKLHPVAATKKTLGKVSKKAAIITGVIVLALVAGFTAFHLISTHNARIAAEKAAKQAEKAAQAASGPTPGTPNYQTVLPAGKTIDQLGGWYRVSPQGRDPVYAFVDNFNGVGVDVSEQPLPANFKVDQAGQLSQLAKSFSANQTLAVNGGTVYLGTSAKGPQSVILIKSNLLILLKSTTLIPDNQWVTYINSLQ